MSDLTPIPWDQPKGLTWTEYDALYRLVGDLLDHVLDTEAFAAHAMTYARGNYGRGYTAEVEANTRSLPLAVSAIAESVATRLDLLRADLELAHKTFPRLRRSY